MRSMGNIPVDPAMRLSLATTDLFIEKAQDHLTYRARRKYAFAGVCGVLALSVLVAFFYFSSPIWRIVDPRIYNGTDWPAVVIFIIQKLLLSGIVFAIIYFLVALSRAFLHEATLLLNRRHALRFGRLIVYLSKGGVDAKTLIDAFGWNLESTTAFLRVNPEVMTKGILTQTIEGAERLTKAARGEKS
jgi:hypothetical protein